MKKHRLSRLTQTVLCLMCFAFVWRYGSFLEGTEFSGGRLTGSLRLINDIGAALFVLAFFIGFFYSRVAAAVAAMASVLSLPLFLYFAAPGPFRWLFRGEYSVPVQATFVWDTWTMFGIALLAVTIFAGLRILLVSGDSNLPA